MNYQYKLYLLLLFVTIGAKAQQPVHTLKPGDIIPDIYVPKIINYFKRTAKTSEFNKQLLIIDFWSTNCKGCVEALPKMQALQKQYGDKIKILPVTYQKERLVMDFWKNNKYTKDLLLPSVVEDTILSSYFKHRSIPHEVWIYKGKVIGITQPEYVDANNISKVLSGAKIEWPVKYDYYYFDPNKPLFNPDKNQIDTSNTIMKYVAISEYREGVQSEGFSGSPGTIRNTSKKTVRTFFLNQPIFGAYLSNWYKVINVNDQVKPILELTPNQIIWEVSDRSRYIHIPGNGYREDWLRHNAICFESQNPDTNQTDKQVAQTIITDMNALLGLNVRWEKRKERVLSLVRKQRQVPRTNRGKTYSIPSLVYELNQRAQNPYVFDESKSEEELHLNVQSWTDIQSLRKELQAYGFDLVEQEKEVDKFVFSEVDGGMFINGEKIAEFKVKKDAQKELKPPSVEENRVFLENNKKRNGVIVLPSGLQYKVLKEGNGVRPTASSRIRVNYTGMLVNGKIFESTDENGRPTDLVLENVIKGWKEALPLMSEGAKWILYIPAEMAYGSHTQQGAIPQNSTLIFEIELLKILP